MSRILLASLGALLLGCASALADGPTVIYPSAPPEVVSAQETTAQIMARNDHPFLTFHRKRGFKTELQDPRITLPSLGLQEWNPRPAPMVDDGGVEPQFSVGAQWLGLPDAGVVIPPDTQGEVGPENVLVILNDNIRSYDRNGNLGTINTSLENFFSSIGSGLFDPRAKFDRATNRWYLVAVDQAVSSNSSAVVAVSSGPVLNSATTWRFFSINIPTAGEWYDYPTIGVDANALTISLNCFSFAGAFTASETYSISKASLTAPSGSLTLTRFRQTSVGATHAPITNDDPAATTTLLVNNGWFDGTNRFLRMYTISSPGTTTATLTQGPFVLVPNFGTFPSANRAPQQGTTARLNTGDVRLGSGAMMQVNPATGTRTVWTAFNVSLAFDGTALNSTNNAGVRWVEIQDPASAAPTVRQAGSLFPTSDSGDHFLFASIAANGQGHAVLGSTITGTGRFASTFVAGRLLSTPAGSMAFTNIPFAGAASYNKDYGSGRNRWGDYTHTVVDPRNNQALWTFQQYASATNTWAVRVIRVNVPGPATPIGLSPNTIQAGQTANIVVTGSSTSGTAFFDPGPGFPDRLEAAFSGTGLTVNSVTVNNDTQLTLNVTAASGAAAGARNLTITNPDRQTSSLSSALTVSTTSVTGLVLPASVQGGGSVNGTVSLSGAAPTGGVTVSLASNSVDLTVPATVTVPAGSSSADFSATAAVVGATRSVTVTASLGSSSATDTITVLPPAVTALSFSPNVIMGGNPSLTTVGTVTIGQTAPTGGVVVRLSSGTPAALTVPTTVTIPAGATTGTFTPTTFSVAANTIVSVRGETDSGFANGSITLRPPRVGRIQFLPGSLVGGSTNTSTGTVTLQAPAPAGGATVNMTTASSLLNFVTSTVTIPAGSTTGTFTIRAGTSVAARTTETVTSNYNGTFNGTIVVIPPRLTTVTFTNNPVVGGSSTVVRVRISISVPAPAGGLVVPIASNNTSVATVPATVTIPAGWTSVSTVVSHKAVAATTNVRITATLDGLSRFGTLTVNP